MTVLEKVIEINIKHWECRIAHLLSLDAPSALINPYKEKIAKCKAGYLTGLFGGKTKYQSEINQEYINMEEIHTTRKYYHKGKKETTLYIFTIKSGKKIEYDFYDDKFNAILIKE